MHEFTTVSSSSYDPAALAAKLNDKSAEGWSVVSIVSTGGDVTAFLSRESTGVPTSAVAAEAEPVDDQRSDRRARARRCCRRRRVDVRARGPRAGRRRARRLGRRPRSAARVGRRSGTRVLATPRLLPPTRRPRPPQPAVPAGWYADPAGRFELRYWDGGTWTEHVSRAGQQFTDPPVA